MFLLLIGSITIGFLLSDLTTGIGNIIWTNVFDIKIFNFTLIEIEFISPLIKNLPTLLCLVLSFIMIILNNVLKAFAEKPTHTLYIKTSHFYNKKLNKFIDRFNIIAYNAGFYNTIYNNLFINYGNNIYYIYTKLLDRGLLEFFGPYGIYRLFSSLYMYYEKWIIVLISFNIYILIFFLLLLLGYILFTPIIYGLYYFLVENILQIITLIILFLLCEYLTTSDRV